jgi:hypothetical protein
MRRDSLPPGVQCESTLENLVNARGRTQAEAWHNVCLQAEATGMLGRGR